MCLKVIKCTKYDSYEKPCESLTIEDLSTRRTRLCWQFANKKIKIQTIYEIVSKELS